MRKIASTILIVLISFSFLGFANSAEEKLNENEKNISWKTNWLFTDKMSESRLVYSII